MQKLARRESASTDSTGAGTRGFLRRLGGELASLLPDSLAWALRASRVGVEIVRRDRPEVIYSTSPSPSAHLAAWLVATRTGLPWVAELRDLWSMRHDRMSTRVRRIPDLILERFIFRRASALVTVSAPLADRLRDAYPKKPVHTVVTGFDPELFAPTDAQLAGDFRLTYAGRIHRQQDPRRLLEPLAKVIASGHVDPARTRVEFLSMETMAKDDRAFIRELSLEGVVLETAFMPRETVIARERASQVLLHFRWDEPHESGILTGKIFEYLAAQRPILSTGRYEDAVSALLGETGAGVATTTDAETEAFIIEAFQAYKSAGRVAYRGRRGAIEMYDARRTAAAVGEVLNTVFAGGREA
jgi:glycosyltransferase involved in cell wall biosynthesis